MNGYDFHPEARFDLDEIWEFIRADNLDAADRILPKFWLPLKALSRFPIRAIDAQTSPHGRCGSCWCVTMWLLMPRRKSRYGL
jgi:hypothetical protein